MNNSRMKDFFDLAVIARTSELDGATLVSASRPATRPLPPELQYLHQRPYRNGNGKIDRHNEVLQLFD